ncbi:MAG: bifunctional glutamate N-acetyltransferase/amino-acid acetyltransferase ArgJ [Myxococcaceae bacterium]|nr:bifunctional glutamate N-acetyltransferase/amino-acid acetyltransferase ArgJ [Myxococcaceae bacterium]
MKTPNGFSFSGVAAGIKPHRKDLALVVSDVPCAAAGCFTVNRACAAPVRDARARLPREDIRAVVINSGNANALTGPLGLEDVQTVHQAVGAALGIDPSLIVSASTGVIGMRLPVHKIADAAPALVQQLDADPLPAAEAILTTDTRVKMASRTIHLHGREVTLSAICKGSGMIAPQLATMIAVIVTDCAISAAALDRALKAAMEPSFNNLTVDDDMSTNDAVFALANGRAGNPRICDPGPDFEALSAALRDLCVELAREIAADGEGATRLIEVTVRGAPSTAIARDLAKSIAGSSLVKAAMFGADPNWGRILATVGARAGSQGFDVHPEAATVTLQGVVVYRREPVQNDPIALRRHLREPEVKVEVALDAGDDAATAWGCDLSYDYVKINADYSSLIVPGPDGGVAKDDRLGNYSPAFKVSLLVEALSYISRFAGKRCVIQYGGAAMGKESLKKAFCEDVNLLRSVGLKPIVVHGGGPEDAHTAEMLGKDLVALLNRHGSHAVGVSGKDGGLLRAKRLAAQSGPDAAQPGEITSVNGAFLELLIQQGYVPVISPIGIGDDGQSYHLDADAAACAVATALGVEKLLYLSDGAGILEGGELLSELSAAALREKVDAGVITGGMLARARAILSAIDGGVRQVHVIDGRTPHSLIAELFTERGVGTLVTRG